MQKYVALGPLRAAHPGDEVNEHIWYAAPEADELLAAKDRDLQEAAHNALMLEASAAAFQRVAEQRQAELQEVHQVNESLTVALNQYMTGEREQYERPDHRTVASLRLLAKQIHALNHKWWHDVSGKPLERNKGELLMLICSEVAECMEGERKSLKDSHLPQRPMAEVELADILIRVLDYAQGFGYDIGGAVLEKLEYNAQREDHTYEARARAQGKKW